MTITLADMVESEKICEAATEGPWFKFQEGEGNLEQHGVRGDVWDAYFHSRGDARFIAHARTRLPKMNKLVREMYELFDECAGVFGIEDCRCPKDEEHPCVICKVESLVERMEGAQP